LRCQAQLELTLMMCLGGCSTFTSTGVLSDRSTFTSTGVLSDLSTFTSTGALSDRSTFTSTGALSDRSTFTSTGALNDHSTFTLTGTLSDRHDGSSPLFLEDLLSSRGVCVFARAQALSHPIFSWYQSLVQAKASKHKKQRRWYSGKRSSSLPLSFSLLHSCQSSSGGTGK
jgi:hypothetical protein